MPYSNKQMLRDANGDLIPQYWDVVEQEFKPLTGQNGANDVRLTGRNVEEVFIEHVPAKSEFLTDMIHLGDCEKFTLSGRVNTGVDGLCKVDILWFRSDSDGDAYRAAEDIDVLDSENYAKGSSLGAQMIEKRSPYMKLVFRNTHTSSRTFFVTLEKLQR